MSIDIRYFFKVHRLTSVLDFLVPFCALTLPRLLLSMFCLVLIKEVI